ncbi:MAG: integrase [Niastella sp. SCN 39-18]|nr:tyrosine-type recombinase/integrase [Sphingobacteriales bacterium]ODT52972.1 MAG: integrase [Niastella sp. SCN 39-18]OJW08748.1 MAG: integrase [Sphingobacteriales bacterium 39-19]
MPHTHQPYLTEFLAYLKFQKRYSRHTLVAYENDLTGFFNFLELQYAGIELPEIKAIFIRSWLAAMKEKNEAEAKTLNRKISSLKSFFKFLMKKGVIDITPMDAVATPKLPKRVPHFVDEKDMSRLFDPIRFANDWMGKTEKLILVILYQTGIRKSELINLQEGHIDWGNHTIKVLGKGNKERIIPVSAGLTESMKNYSKEKKEIFESLPHPNLLVGKKGLPLDPKQVYIIVRKYLTQITTIEKKSPHILRHSFATHIANNGAPLQAVKELLGHSSLAATQVYTHTSIEKLKDVHKKAHPKA